MKFPKGVEVCCEVIIENSQGQILLTKAPKWSNKWTILGGHIEPGESILDAARREGEEETSLKLKPVSIINSGEEINPRDFYRKAHFIYFDVLCKVIGGKIKLDKNELSEYKWVSTKEALGMDLVSCHADHLEKIKNYLSFKNKNSNK